MFFEVCVLDLSSVFFVAKSYHLFFVEHFFFFGNYLQISYNHASSCWARKNYLLFGRTIEPSGLA